MSDPLRTDDSRAAGAAPEPDRDAKIEQLLLAGLDHYLSGQYDHAISAWTRVLFLDRSHPRARAYIERARSALAERQRESEELLQSGMAAFQRGDGREARRLVQAAIETGAPSDEALAVLTRLDRLESSSVADAPPRARPPRREGAPAVTASARRSRLAIAIMTVLTMSAAGMYSAALLGTINWRTPIVLQSAPAETMQGDRLSALALPRRGEQALARARALAADGHLRDALAQLDLIRPTDSQKAEADQLRGEIQLQLIALTPVPAQPAPLKNPGPGGAREERPVP
jgi:hypothetical protein